MAQSITVSVLVGASLQKAWETWTQPEHITKWNFASPEWECPSAVNHLVVGGEFNYRMAAKYGSMGFDFSGIYSQVIPLELIEFSLGERTVQVKFEAVSSNQTKITETFEVEDLNSLEMQRQGWQAILENYKRQAELS